jgi:hypothetical protein
MDVMSDLKYFISVISCKPVFTSQILAVTCNFQQHTTEPTRFPFLFMTY